MDPTKNSTDFRIDAEFSLDRPLAKSMSKEQQAFKLSTFVVGFLVNAIIFLVIVFSRQLHYPRHIFWIGVSLINYFYLIQCALELVAKVNQDPVACSVYVFNAGVGYSALLLCLSLAACDRYSAIARYEWYKTKITNRAVVMALISSFSLTFAVITSPFWTGFKSASSCTVNLTHMHWVLAWDLLLGIFSVVLHVKIYIISRAIISQHAPNLNQLPMTQRFFTNQENNPLDPSEDNGMLRTAVEENNCLARFLPLSGSKSLEIRTALQLSVNILPFWICTIPLTCNSLALYYCMKFQVKSSLVFTTNFYMRDLFLIHVIYNPIMYSLTNAEFQRAFVHFIRKLFRMERN